MTCFIKIEFITEEFFYKEHKHCKLIKMESMYKSNKDQAEKLGII
jgi:hypothetical protein